MITTVHGQLFALLLRHNPNPFIYGKIGLLSLERGTMRNYKNKGTQDILPAESPNGSTLGALRVEFSNVTTMRYVPLFSKHYEVISHVLLETQLIIVTKEMYDF